MHFPSKKFTIFIILLSLFAGCASIPLGIQSGDSVVVWDLENYTPGDENQINIGEMLSAAIIQEMNRHRGITVVEREKLILALDELGFGSSELVDESTRLKVGMIVGAGYMIFGGYQVINKLVRIDIRVIEVETGRLIKAGQRLAPASDMAGWISAAKEITKELIHDEHP